MALMAPLISTSCIDSTSTPSIGRFQYQLLVWPLDGYFHLGRNHSSLVLVISAICGRFSELVVARNLNSIAVVAVALDAI